MQITPLISAIAAMAENRVIGIDNQLPWHLPADLRHFKQLTTGHAILMGRKTYESIGKPLPNRLNLILTRDPNYKAAGCLTVTSLENALHQATADKRTDLFIIGGAQIYRQLLPNAYRLYLTIVHQQMKGDALFPEINKEEWREIEHTRHPADAENEYAYSFMRLERVALYPG